MTTKRGSSKKASKKAPAVLGGKSGKNPVVETVRQLARIADTHGLCELTIESEGLNLTLRRPDGAQAALQPGHFAPIMQATPAMVHDAGAAPASPNAQEEGHLVTSPFVGTFYRSPNPDSAPYAQLGDRVEKGKVLCIVEAMKLMNEIEADMGGEIVAVLVENGEPVEYGQPLFRIVPG